MKICVTGSSGHLGEALTKKLLSLGHDIVGVDILPASKTKFVGSIADRKFVKQCIQNCEAIIHTATLHKPHVATHTMQQFIDTNITGTLNLLEEAVSHDIKRFVFTSTTSTFGNAMSPNKNSAVWVTEDLQPIAKNIYGTTKIAAEDLCQLFHQNHKLPCLVLRVSRFFLEVDDEIDSKPEYSDKNIKALEYLYRRVDLEDVVDAHILALNQVKEIGFNKCIISATTPFAKEDCKQLMLNAPFVVEKYYPKYKDIFANKNWKMFPTIERVYVNNKARKILEWKPKYDFDYVLNCLQQGQEFYSLLGQSVGEKGYHPQ